MEFDNDKIKILVIDDSDIIRTSLKKFLLEYEIEVLTSNDGLEGLQRAIEHKPRLIFLDLMMPNLDGIRLLKVMKVMEELKRIPVIVISGHTDKVNVIAATEAGADKIVSKPLSKEMLIKSINEVLGSNFLGNTKKYVHLSNSEKEQMTKELRKYFINSLANKRETLRQSLQHKNRELLRLVVHELKGTSGTVGFHNITDICREIEEVLASSENSWSGIELKCKSLIESFHQAELSVAK
jgi:DNA-binding response OmpR family regulator